MFLTRNPKQKSVFWSFSLIFLPSFIKRVCCRRGVIWPYNLQFSSLFITACVPHRLYYWVDATTMDQVTVKFLRRTQDVTLFCFLSFFMTYVCPWVQVSYLGRGASQMCWLEQSLPLDLQLSHLLYPVLPSPTFHAGMYLRVGFVFILRNLFLCFIKANINSKFCVKAELWCEIQYCVHDCTVTTI